MDFIDQINQITSRLRNQVEHLKTEEATKNAAIMPLLNALGYNVFDPTVVVPEFTADVGTKKGEKVDYAIMREGKPSILIECKSIGSELSLRHASQLYRYFSVTDARFAILTNGVDYKFFTDIESANKMDDKPFFEFSMFDHGPRDVEELKKFAAQSFDLENILSNASELKYKRQIKTLIAAEFETPSDDLVRLFTQGVYEGRLTPQTKERFAPLVRDAAREFLRDAVNARLQTALNPGEVIRSEGVGETASTEMPEDDSGIETTDEEIEAFHIVRAILSEVVDPKRVVMRDTKSYCGVLLDDNNRRPLCRFRFNYSKKYLGLFGQGRLETKESIESPVDIFRFSARLKEAVALYDLPLS